MTLRRPSRCACPATSAARAGSSSTEIVSPRSPIRAAICPVLVPGPAQRSRTWSPGRGSRTSTTAAEPRLWGVSSPASTRAGTSVARSARRHDRLRRRPAASGPCGPVRLDSRLRPAPAISRLAVCARRPSWRSRPARCRRRAASGRSRGRAPPTTSAPARAAPSGRRRRARGSSRRRAAPRSSDSRSRTARRRTALTSPEACAAPARLTSSTAWSTAAWSGVRVGEEQLVEAEAQAGENRRVEHVRRALGEALDRRVAGPPPLHRAEGEPLGLGALAAADPAHRRPARGRRAR